MPAAWASNRAAWTVFMPRFSTSSSRCSPWPEGAKAGSSSTWKSPGLTRKGPDSTGSPWARGRSMRMRADSGADQQHHRQGGDAFAAAGETQALAGGGLDRNGAGPDAQIGRQMRAHGLGMRADLRPFADHSDVGIADRPGTLAGQGGAVAQELPAVGILPARIRRWEMPADVAQGQRAQDRIAQGMDDHVAVGVRQHAALVGDPHAAQHRVIAVAEGMHVIALSDPDVLAHCPCLPRRNAASARSAGVVSLMLSSAPSTRQGRRPSRSMAMASSVTVTP